MASWLKARTSDPLDGELFEFVCESWAAGYRAAEAERPPSRTGRPPRPRS